MLHQPLGLQMKLSHHIYELRSEFEEDSTYFTFNNLPSHFIYNVNNDLVAALGGNSNDRASGWVGGKLCWALQSPAMPLPPLLPPLGFSIKSPSEHSDFSVELLCTQHF